LFGLPKQRRHRFPPIWRNAESLRGLKWKEMMGSRGEMSDIQQLEERLVTLVEQGAYAEAIALGEQILRRDSFNVTAMFELGLAHDRKGDAREALSYGRRLVVRSPEEPNAHLNLGVYYQRLGCHRKARQCFERELKRDPYAVEPHFALGKLLFSEQRFKEAAVCFEKCWDYKYRVDDFIEDLATAYFELRDVIKEISVYLRYLEIAPCSTWALGTAGSALLQANDARKALLLLRRAARLDPADLKIQSNLDKARAIHAQSKIGNAKEGGSPSMGHANLKVD
jgi:tetratricopeptide (TPR) repeat protein